MYEVIIGNKVEKKMAKLPKNDYQRVKEKMLSLENNPRPFGYIKMKTRDAYRIIEGNYRIIYEIEDQIKIVAIVDVGHRKDIYRKK